MAYADEWYCSAPITIDKTKCGGAITLKIYLNEDNLPDEMLDADGMFPAKADGGDIRFSTDSAGAVPAKFHLVEFTQNNNPALASANIWVSMLVSAIVDKVLYVWWRNADADALPIDDTYGQYETWKASPACYARWMCDDGQDASENNVDFSETDVVFGAGVIDDCAEFDADETAAFTYLTSQEYFWWTGWVYIDSGSADPGGVITCDPFRVFIDFSGAGYKVRFLARFSDKDGYWSEDTVLAFDTWHHVSVGYDGRNVANDPTWAINGVTPAQTENTTPVGTLESGSASGYLASLGGASRMTGKLDEMYLKLLDPLSDATHLAYELTQYNNQGDPGNFAAPGAMEISKRGRLRV